MSNLCSGDVGFCHYTEQPRGLIITWDSDNRVISVDCEHNLCGYADRCELYQAHPVGYTQSFPISRTSQND